MMRWCILLLAVISLSSCAKKSAQGPVDENGGEYPWAGRVTASSLLVRDAPGIGGKVVDRVLRGHRIDVTGKTDRKDTVDGASAYWYKVMTQKKTAGYAFGEYIEKTVSRETYSAPKESVMKCPDSIQNSYECAEYIEKIALPSVRGKAEVKDGLIVISCADGKKVTLEDAKKEAVNGSWYSLLHYYSAERLFLVHVQYYEGGTFYLINEANGEVYTVWSEPLFSPDGVRFVCSSIDMDANYLPNGIQVWTKKGSGYTKDYEEKFSWGPATVKWSGNAEIGIERIDGAPGRYMSFSAELRYVEGKWKLDE